MHNNMIKVSNETDLARDPFSGAVINTNISGYKTYLELRERAINAKVTLEQNTNDIAELKQEVGNIKDMLSKILEAVQK